MGLFDKFKKKDTNNAQSRSAEIPCSGANMREAFYTHSKADFIAKLQIILKELSKSEYWFELLIER